MKILLDSCIAFILFFHLVKADPPLQCYECSSESGESCAAPNLNKNADRLTTICANNVKMCFTQIQNGKIIRGCVSNENANSSSKRLLDSNSTTYQTCLTPMCNDEEIKKEFCIVCDSESHPDCKHDPSTKMARQCPLSIKPQGCLMYQNQKNSVKRDCMSADEKLRGLCLNEKDQTCKYCFGDECNKQRYFAVCQSCKSYNALDDDCMNSPWLTDLETCQNYVDDCYTHIDDRNIVSRGCFSTFPTDKHNCTDPDTCLRCSGDDACNDIAIKTESCITCDSKDPNCRDNVSSKMLKKCRLSTKLMGCYHLEENDEIKRGCISDVQDEQFRRLCESNKNKCKESVENASNEQKVFQKCLTGSHSDPQTIGTATFESKTCTNHKDECYTHVANNVIRKGCLSDAKTFLKDGIDVESDCKDSDVCEKCSGSIDCNNKNIQKEFCIICDSKNQTACNYSPNYSMRGQCPLSIRPLGCLLFENGTSVKRDCMSTDSELRELCLAESDTCKYCFGDGCNIKQHFSYCCNCSSAQDGYACITTPWITKLQTCKHYLDECFTHINDDGIVTRGCLDDFRSDKGDCTNKDTCVRCSGGIGCNDIRPLKESCISCDSNDDSNCRSNVTLENSEVCPQKSIRRLGCFHFINETGGHTKRGCVSSLSTNDRNLEAKQPNKWKYCRGSDNCNSKTTFTKCLACDSSVNFDCISNPTLSGTSVKLCNNYDDSCFSVIGFHIVVRGCSNDMDWKSRISEKVCHDSPEKCDICKNSENGEICNSKRFNGAKCISCDSEKDKRCHSEPELTYQKLCGLVNSPDEDLGCYLMRDSTNRTRRGCVSDLTAQDRFKCLNGTDQCQTCKGDNCNKKVEFQYCYVCTSRNDPICAQTDPSQALTMCPNYLDQCLTAIDSEGFTVRQCVSNQTRNSDPNKFSMHNVCEESKCNGNIFPENRLQCFQCDGDRLCDRLRTNENVSLEEKPCAVYSKIDQCFMYMDDEHNMHRGCLTDWKESRLFCLKRPHMCVTCSENGCNNRTLVIEPTSKCHQCKDSTNCTFGLVNQDTIVNCNMPVIFGAEESCYTRSFSDGSVERGCTLDAAVGDPDWCKDIDECNECKGHGCNNENIQFSFCLQCHSTDDIDCKNPANGTETFNVKCVPIHNNSSVTDNAVKTAIYDPYSFTERGCYIINRGDKVQRGCLVDLSVDEREECKTNYWCNTCENDNCNDVGLPSTANIIRLSSFSFFIYTIVTIIHYTRIKLNINI
ncbi:uncharacterized protein LOC129573250 [Sitodiplosis mosellana]|uniref:uncharacterized protein LOC129573250 n=1 Tax=Sitodiplosis mosellana TaxID=263140 RepID=UPI002443922E|nr:uncharacterized protein LOC129573250 [Sitodiplosis mosellana]